MQQRPFTSDLAVLLLRAQCYVPQSRVSPIFRQQIKILRLVCACGEAQRCFAKVELLTGAACVNGEKGARCTLVQELFRREVVFIQEELDEMPRQLARDGDVQDVFALIETLTLAIMRFVALAAALLAAIHAEAAG